MLMSMPGSASKFFWPAMACRVAATGNPAPGRVGQADYIADVVNALLSDDCYWINGQRIEASGGQVL
jgi:hypothetical protein